MKKLKFLVTLIPILVLFITVLYSCTKSDKDVTKTEKQQQTDQTQTKTQTTDTLSLKEAKYVCPMHPLERSMTPAKCPICKMNMVSIEQINKEMSEEHEKLETKFAGTKNAIPFEVNLSPVKSEDCIPVIESALGKDAGVIGYHVDILNRIVHIYLDKSKTTKKNVEQLISDAGFDANSIKANPEAFNKIRESCK